MRAPLCLLAAAFLVSVPTPGNSRAAKPAPPYVVHDLGTLGGDTSAAYAINNSNQIVGEADTGATSTNSTVHHAFLFEDGDMKDLGTLGGYQSTAYGINASGQVVGAADLSTVKTWQYHAFQWSRLTGMQDISASPDAIQCEAFAISSSGLAVGDTTSLSINGVFAAMWFRGRTATIGSGNGGSCTAYALNDRGDVVGFRDTTSNSSEFFHCKIRLHGMGEPAVRPLDPRNRLGDVDGTAYGINARGEIVGGFNGPFLWRGGVLRRLPVPAQGSDYRALAINDRGDIVGDGDGHAVLWHDGAASDLNALVPQLDGWTLQSATSINNRRFIVGYGLHHGLKRAFLLSPSY